MLILAAMTGRCTALPSAGQNPVYAAGGGLDAVFRSAAGHIGIDQPQIQIVEKLRCFQAEIMEIAGAIHRGDIHQGNEFIVRFDQLKNPGGLFELVWIARIQRAFSQPSAAV